MLEKSKDFGNFWRESIKEFSEKFLQLTESFRKSFTEVGKTSYEI